MNTFSYALYNLFKPYLQPNASVHHNCLIGYWFYFLMSRPCFQFNHLLQHIWIWVFLAGFPVGGPLPTEWLPLPQVWSLLVWRLFLNRHRWTKKIVHFSFLKGMKIMNVKIPSIFRTYVLPLMRVIRDQFWMDRKRRLKLVGRPNYKLLSH